MWVVVFQPKKSSRNQSEGAVDHVPQEDFCLQDSAVCHFLRGLTFPQRVGDPHTNSPVNGIDGLSSASQATVAAVANVGQRVAGANTVYGPCQFYEPSSVHV